MPLIAKSRPILALCCRLCRLRRRLKPHQVDAEPFQAPRLKSFKSIKSQFQVTSRRLSCSHLASPKDGAAECAGRAQEHFAPWLLQVFGNMQGEESVTPKTSKIVKWI